MVIYEYEAPGGALTISRPMMPCDIILLILSLIRYKFWGWKVFPKIATIILDWKVLTFSAPKNATNFFGWKGFNPF
jgi:hypothetical protein